MSTRQGAERGGGLGLGLFIAKTLLERSGAKLTFGNRTGDRPGARVSVDWPRARMEARGAK
jgi:two-component system sensor histidine kinase RegB